MKYPISCKKTIFCIISFCIIFLSSNSANAYAGKIQNIAERANDMPVTMIWLEPGSVILNVMVVNPSTTKTQKAILKAYLPKEAKPEDIIDLGDLEITYDIEKGLYYAFKEFELGPGEMVKRSVHIKDIWMIRESELQALLARAEEILKELKGTGYADAAAGIKQDMNSKNTDILAKQKEAMDALPEPHIAAYRRNLEALSAMKADLAELESMLSRAKPASGVAVKRIFVKASWWIILAVIGALLLLSFVFFFIWHKQAETIEEEHHAEGGEPESQPPQNPEEGGGSEGGGNS